MTGPEQTTEQSNKTGGGCDCEKGIPLHSALVNRHNTLNQLLWEAPVISLTAQAFLLTIAFDSFKTPFYRAISGIVAFGIGMLSWQLFCRHAAYEIQVSKDLEKLEKVLFGRSVHERPKIEGCPSGIRSRLLWSTGLFIISLAGLVPILKSLLSFKFPWLKAI